MFYNLSAVVSHLKARHPCFFDIQHILAHIFSHPTPAQQCSEGWSQVGEACLRINSSRESYDNAQHYCKNLNGNIASLTTSKQVDFVLEELMKLQEQDKVNTLTLSCLNKAAETFKF